VIRTLSDKIGEQLTTHLRAIADANPLLKGIIDRVDFNATTHRQRDIGDDRLSNLIEEISLYVRPAGINGLINSRFS
jgi:type I restriction enzyme M protein